MKPQPDEQNDFRAYAHALWRWKWLLLAFLIVIPLISYVLEARKTAEYESSTLVKPTGGVGRPVAVRRPVARAAEHRRARAADQDDGRGEGGGEASEEPAVGPGLAARVHLRDADTTRGS